MPGLGSLIAGGGPVVNNPMLGQELAGAPPESLPGVGPPVDEVDAQERTASWSEVLQKPEVIAALLSFGETISQPNANFSTAVSRAVQAAGATAGSLREQEAGARKEAQGARGFETSEQLKRAQIGRLQQGEVVDPNEAALLEARLQKERAELKNTQAELPFIGGKQKAEIAKLQAQTQRAQRPDRGFAPQAPPAVASDVQSFERLLAEGKSVDEASNLIYGSKGRGKAPEEIEKAFVEDFVLTNSKEAVALGQAVDYEDLVAKGKAAAKSIHGEAKGSPGTKAPDPRSGGALDQAKLKGILKKHGMTGKVKVNPLPNGDLEIQNETGTVLRTIKSASFQ